MTLVLLLVVCRRDLAVVGVSSVDFAAGFTPGSLVVDVVPVLTVMGLPIRITFPP